MWGGALAEAQAPLLIMGSVSPVYGNNPGFVVVTLGEGGGGDGDGGGSEGEGGGSEGEGGGEGGGGKGLGGGGNGGGGDVDLHPANRKKR